jgi:hypothetical protein
MKFCTNVLSCHFRKYGDNEIFFNFTKKETDISLVMETRLLQKFPMGTLLNIENDYWKLIRIGQLPVGLGMLFFVRFFKS